MCLNPQNIDWIRAVDKPDLQYDEECVDRIMSSEDFDSFGFAEGEYHDNIHIFLLGLDEDLRPLISNRDLVAEPLNSSEDHLTARSFSQEEITFENRYSRDELLS